MNVLVTGATGFVGSRLTPALVAAGHEVRALTRRPAEYQGAGSAVGGDVADQASIVRALEGAQTAYYLVHSLDRPDFAERDAQAARSFGQAAAIAGVQRIIYLGGLGSDADQLSAHLRSRQEVEALLGEAGVAVTTVRAGVIIGHGGLSWELMRELVAHLPLMVTPRWVRTRAQPVAVDDVVAALVRLLELPDTAGQTLEIGGPDVLTYEFALHRVARLQHRPLAVLPVPLLTPKLSSLWLALVTSVNVQTARNLVESMSNEVVVRDNALGWLLANPPTSFDDAVRTALAEREAASAAA